MTAIDFGRNSASSRILIAPAETRRARPPHRGCYGADASATSAAADLLSSRVHGHTHKVWRMLPPGPLAPVCGEDAMVDIATRNLPEAEARGLEAGSDHYLAYVGPPDQYDLMGATQFRLLTTLGLRSFNRLLD
ncbi:MAG TPA: hypothetical protein VEK82_04760, partial [Stellaceae bacterium]|nr:hypothetical protein [Stellaceae bacterium]